MCLGCSSGSSSSAFFCLEELGVFHRVVRMNIAYFALRYSVLGRLKFGNKLDIFVVLFQGGGCGVRSLPRNNVLR